MTALFAAKAAPTVIIVARRTLQNAPGRQHATVACGIRQVKAGKTLCHLGKALLSSAANSPHGIFTDMAPASQNAVSSIAATSVRVGKSHPAIEEATIST